MRRVPVRPLRAPDGRDGRPRGRRGLRRGAAADVERAPGVRRRRRRAVRAAGIVDHRDPTTGPVWDLLAAYVLACGLHTLTRVYVGERLVSTEGRCAGSLQARADDELRERIPHATRAAGAEPAP